MEALAKANRVRLRQAEVKREIREGDRYVPDLILGDDEIVGAMRVIDLLRAQPKWGRTRARRVLSIAFSSRLARDSITAEQKRLRDLTDRERKALAAAVQEAAGPRRNGNHEQGEADA